MRADRLGSGNSSSRSNLQGKGAGGGGRLGVAGDQVAELEMLCVHVRQPCSPRSCSPLATLHCCKKISSSHFHPLPALAPLQQPFSPPTAALRAVFPPPPLLEGMPSLPSPAPALPSLSHLPGLRSAPSRASILLVAPMTTTCPLASRPSISASSVLTMEL